MTSQSQRNLFKSYLAPVLDTAYGTALYLTGDGREAEDLVQAAAVSAFRAFAARPAGDFKVWFLRILTHQFLTRTESGAQSPKPGPPLRGGAPQSRGRSPLIAAFAALPVEQRAVCALYFMDDFSYADMAEMTGSGLESTRRDLHEGRARLQESLREPAPRTTAPTLSMAALICA